MLKKKDVNNLGVKMSCYPTHFFAFPFGGTGAKSHVVWDLRKKSSSLLLKTGKWHRFNIPNTLCNCDMYHHVRQTWVPWSFTH